MPYIWGNFIKRLQNIHNLFVARSRDIGYIISEESKWFLQIEVMQRIMTAKIGC